MIWHTAKIQFKNYDKKKTFSIMDKFREYRSDERILEKKLLNTKALPTWDDIKNSLEKLWWKAVTI